MYETLEAITILIALIHRAPRLGYSLSVAVEMQIEEMKKFNIFTFTPRTKRFVEGTYDHPLINADNVIKIIENKTSLSRQEAEDLVKVWQKRVVLRDVIMETGAFC